MLVNLSKRFYSPRFQSPAIKAATKAYQKEKTIHKSDIIDGSLPDTHSVINSQKNQQRLQVSPENVIKILGCIPFTRHSKCNENVYIAKVDFESNRKALVSDLQGAFKNILVDPKEGPDEGWTCCHILNQSQSLIVHIMSPEAADYYSIHELYS